MRKFRIGGCGMHLVTSGEMRAIDQYAIQTIGLPSLVLMENAGRAVAEEVIRLSEKLHQARGQSSRPPRWLILAGKGNNGGDGIVAARHLAEAGYEVHVLYAVPPEDWKGEAAVQRDIAEKIALPSSVYKPGEPVSWERWDGIVDALLGTGTMGPPREPYASLIREACASGLPIVSVDMPSGLNADTGETADPCIRARVTVALALMKRGLLLHPGAEMAGEVVVRPIGIPEAAVQQQQVKTYLLNETLLRRRFGLEVPPARKADTHKGTYGHVLVAAGSKNMSGAGLLCSRAALRSGAGLVTWAVPELLALPMAGRLPEVMIHGMEDAGSGEWSAVDPQLLIEKTANKQVMVLGPGMGRWPGDSAWLRLLWESSHLPLVLDADALNMMADSDEPLTSWPKRTHPAILTPHPGEMARLCGITTAEVQRGRIELARRFAAEHGVTLVLKGANTVVAAPDGSVYVNTTGNPGMATGGAGDVLAGIIGGLLAQGLDSVAAAALGVYWHGLAGDRAAAARHAAATLIAGDIIEAL
jgi:NAD(P)H-hydrate epimerase